MIKSDARLLRGGQELLGSVAIAANPVKKSGIKPPFGGGSSGSENHYHHYAEYPIVKAVIGREQVDADRGYDPCKNNFFHGASSVDFIKLFYFYVNLSRNSFCRYVRRGGQLCCGVFIEETGL
jgi:hypothetical protein